MSTSTSVSSDPPHPATIPSLSNLCIDAIASKIDRDRFHPQEIGVLSEPEWELVVKRRHCKTAPRQQGKGGCPGGGGGGGGGLDGTGRSVPAIPVKVLLAIEGANPHLNRSAAADTLVWRDCVEYKFKTGGPSRPRALQYPWPMLVDRVKKSGDDLLGLLQHPPNGAETIQQRTRTLHRSIQTLSEAPMSVPLLTASGVGKSVKKFLKGCSKLRPSNVRSPSECDISDYVPDVWTPRLAPGARPGAEAESPLSRLERLLDGWKAIASSSGVVVAGGKVDNGASPQQHDFSGRGRKTTEEQHAEDMSRLQTCQQWRDVYAALLERETRMVASHGARMKKLREDLETERRKIGKVSIRSVNKRARQDDILSGTRGARAIAAAAASRTGGGLSDKPSKFQQLRREATVKTSMRVPVGSGAPRSRTAPPVRNAIVKPAAMSFGASVAIANSKSRASTGSSGLRKKGIVGNVGKREVVLSGGRKMALPRKSGGTGVFSSIADKKRRAAEMAALQEKRRRETDMTPRFKR